MSLAENIYRFRTEQNMSQLDLADALEVSRQSVSKWETGAAVPELDKLIKMAKLFGVTLDELVSGEAPAPKEEPVREAVPEPQVIYIEKPVFPTVKRQHIIGGVILFCALIYGLILYQGFSAEETLSMVLPVVGCGIVFLLTAHPLFYSSWLCVLGYWDHFFILFPRWEEHTFLQSFGIALVVFMYCRSVSLHHRRRLRIPIWAWITVTTLLLGLGILLLLNSPLFSWLIGY